MIIIFNISIIFILVFSFFLTNQLVEIFSTNFSIIQNTKCIIFTLFFLIEIYFNYIIFNIQNLNNITNKILYNKLQNKIKTKIKSIADVDKLFLFASMILMSLSYLVIDQEHTNKIAIKETLSILLVTLYLISIIIVQQNLIRYFFVEGNKNDE